MQKGPVAVSSAILSFPLHAQLSLESHSIPKIVDQHFIAGEEKNHAKISYYTGPVVGLNVLFVFRRGTR